MFQNKPFRFLFVLASVLFAVSCKPTTEQPQSSSVVTRLKDVPSVRLNYRYEPDVPPPDLTKKTAEERNPAIQAHFDQNRVNELLDKTIPSPDGKRVLAVYHQPTDTQSEFRLDMYSSEGVLMRKITADAMAAHFPDTIVWSPDSSTAAFVATTRMMTNPLATPTPPEGGRSRTAPTLGPSEDMNSNSAANGDPEANPEGTTPAPQSTPQA